MATEASASLQGRMFANWGLGCAHPQRGHHRGRGGHLAGLGGVNPVPPIPRPDQLITSMLLANVTTSAGSGRAAGLTPSGHAKTISASEDALPNWTSDVSVPCRRVAGGP